MKSRLRASTAPASTTTGRISTDTGKNLLEPGETPQENAQFLLFLPAVIKAVDEYQDLLRIDRRQRGQRPPPRRKRGAAGHHLHVPRRRAGRPSSQSIVDGTRLHRGKRVKHATSASTSCRPSRRIRPTATAPRPFAFTGNKFEFRMPGSASSIAGAEHRAEHADGREPAAVCRRAGGRARISTRHCTRSSSDITARAPAHHLQRRRLCGRMEGRKLQDAA